jgi:hypothetical protein
VTRDECLEAARLCISHDRNETYGSPSSSFGVVAALWTTLLSRKLRPGAKLAARAAILSMAPLKLARLAHNPAHDDSAIDLAGYAAIFAEASSLEEDMRAATDRLDAMESDWHARDAAAS